MEGGEGIEGKYAVASSQYADKTATGSGRETQAVDLKNSI